MLSHNVLDKGTVIAQLMHKTIRNRTMPVVVDFDQVVGEPQRIPGVGWTVPCDVVGLTSKKAKLVKVRFHPSTSKLIHSDHLVATDAMSDALKYLDALLDHSDWTRHATKAVDHRIGHLERIAHFLRIRPPALSFTSRSLDIIWSLHSESHACNGKLVKVLKDALCSLHNHSVATAMTARVQERSANTLMYQLGCDPMNYKRGSDTDELTTVVSSMSTILRPDAIIN